ncbi:unnamed protein product [Rotaria sp. Silwood1]|nr:unnamed protein product [Rotaria sp. Silwood1]
MLPPDYETDIETVWSNPNLFADGDDFSWETIQKNRNLYYQQQGSNDIVGQVEDVLSKAVSTLTYHMNVGQTNVISSNSILMKTEKRRIDKLDSFTIPPAAGTRINLPTLSYCSLLFQNEFCSNSTAITINSVVLPSATAGYNGRTQTNINMSRSVSLSLFDSNGTTIPLNNLPTPIEIIIPRDPNLLLPSMTLQNVTGQTKLTKENNNRQFSIYYINITSSTKSLTLSATFEFKSDNLSLGYMLIFRFDAVPILNSTMNQTDGYKIFCPAAQILTVNDGYIYSYFLDNTRTINHQYVIFGIRELNSTEFQSFCSNNASLSSPMSPVTDTAINFTSNYHIRAYTSACYYLDKNSYWQTKDIVVGSQTSYGQTQCYTSHLTTFAGGWIVLPAPINWNYVFAHADFSKNKAIYLTMILLAIFYILFMIYARYKDKKDIEKLGVTPLPDNLINDKYYYQIIVFTGFRKDAGTKSKVHFVISGDDEETGVRTFEDPHRKILQRGSIDSFIMAVPKSLGRLNYMRIWHDNSGLGSEASWFLKYIIVRDLQTMEKNHFICQEWFAVEKDDGVIDRVIPVAGEAQKVEFAYLLSKTTYYSMSDGHLWFSVISRPPSTRFTRVQRCTCCFVLLLMSISLLTFRSKSGHIPLTEGELIDARNKRLNEIKMWDIIRELLAYSSFLWILYVVSYSNRDPNAYFIVKHLKQDLLDLNSATNDYTQIYHFNQYWDWLRTSFVPHIRASKWYNDAPPTNLTGYINDKTNRILGWATMRQLRVKPNSCTIVSSFQNISSSCEAGYSTFNEDQRSFNPGWTSVYNSTIGYIGNYSLSIRKAFMYNKSQSLDTYAYVGEHATYSGGGYVYEFRGKMHDMISNISLLQQLSWIDMQTRAVIIQMSLYNPNVNLFIFVTIIAEFLPTGGIYPSARVEPISLLNNFQGFALFKLICGILYMIFIIYYMQREIRSLFNHRMKYFRDFWSYPEIGIIACSWAGLFIYLWRIREGNRISDLFKETNGYAYVNLQLASYVNDLLTFLLGFCCFFGTVKFLRLLRFNQRMSMLSSTLMYAAKDLISFSFMFSIVYFGYLTLFFLLFHSKLLECSNPLSTAQMLFEMMLLKFDVSDLYAADIFLGPFCFTLFIVFVVFICMNMFISIIADSFRVVRHNISLQNSEHEIVDFMVNQMKKWTGIGRPKGIDRLHLNPFDGTRVHYHDPITSFPDKMDELLIALNKVYMDTKRNDTLMFRPMSNNTSEIIEKTNIILDNTDKNFKN